MSENVSSSSSLSSKTINKDDKVVSIRRYLGKPWERLFNALPETAIENNKEEKGSCDFSLLTVQDYLKNKIINILEKNEAFVHRLGVRDMGLYGLFPETDRFTAVVCDCGVVVKPQGLKNHLARNHSGSLKYSGNYC